MVTPRTWPVSPLSTDRATPASLPVFIGGFRSGTTLLVNLLGLYPAITPWFETKALCEALRWLRVLNNPACADFEGRLINPPKPPGFSGAAVAERMRHDLRATAARLRGDEPSGKAAHERYPIGHDCVLYTVAEAETALARWRIATAQAPCPAIVARATGALINALGTRHAQLAGKPRWVNKTPEISRFGGELRQCLGPCRLILLIRDGRQVVRSASQLGWADAKEIAGWWKGLIEETRAVAAADPDHYLEMRYEDLVDDPADQLNRLLRFLGMAPQGEQLVADYQRCLGKDAFDGRAKALTSAVAGEDGRVVDTIAGDLLQQLGYR